MTNLIRLQPTTTMTAQQALDSEIAQAVEPEREFYGSEPWEHPL